MKNAINFKRFFDLKKCEKLSYESDFNIYTFMKDILKINIINTNTGYVYIIRTEENNYCKIGYSENPSKRLKQIQTSNPCKLYIFCKIKGCIMVEQYLHHIFSSFNKTNEWFELSDNTLQLLKNILITIDEQND